jgi:hypothetical protein
MSGICTACHPPNNAASLCLTEEYRRSSREPIGRRFRSLKDYTIHVLGRRHVTLAAHCCVDDRNHCPLLRSKAGYSRVDRTSLLGLVPLLSSGLPLIVPRIVCVRYSDLLGPCSSSRCSEIIAMSRVTYSGFGGLGLTARFIVTL